MCLIGATKLVSLAKCLVPRHEIPERTVKSLISWCLASINELPITVSTIIIQWTVGNIFFFFFFLFKSYDNVTEQNIYKIKN